MKLISILKKSDEDQRVAFASIVLLIVTIALSTVTSASITGTEFLAVYTFIFDAATGYLGRAIALAGGLIGLGFGAASGKPVVAVVGIVLAIFGALGPQIINALFGSAVI
jgi:putative Mn2+ efflux pump MntP